MRSAPESTISSIDTSEFHTLRANYVNWWLSKQAPIDFGLIRAILDSQLPDGSWADVDYADQSSAAWLPSKHFTAHLHPLLVAFASPERHHFSSLDVESAIIRGIDFWLALGPTSPNWWFNMIFTPAYGLGPTLVVMKDHLTDGQKERGIEILDRCRLRLGPDVETVYWRDGGNCIFDCFAAFNLAVLAEDEALIQTIYSDQLFKCHRITPHDVAPGDVNQPSSGIKEDFSHWEHGNLLYNHGYGALLAEGAVNLALLAKGTSLPISNDGINFVADYILDGCQWMGRNGWLAFDALGREIVRPAMNDIASRRGKDSYFVSAARTLLEFDSVTRRHELRELVERSAKTADAMPLVGNRMFYVSDYMVHQRPSYFASVRMYSERVFGTEVCNRENLHGHHLADGASYLVRSGDEYAGDIPALWDWHKIPGTTVSQGTFHGSVDRHPLPSGMTAQFPAFEATEVAGMDEVDLNIKRWGKTKFAGGVSNGMYGAAGFELAVLSLSAQKAWFFFDDSYLCVGSGISETADCDVITTIDQRNLVGEVAVIKDGSRNVLATGTHRLQGPATILHDGVGYECIDASLILVEISHRTGNWQDINEEADLPASGDVLLIAIDHGRSPFNSSYAYRVVPDWRISEKSAVSAAPNSLEIVNRTDVQAVFDADLGIIYAVFYEPADVLIGGLQVEAKQPCILMIDQASKILHASDPSRQSADLQIRLKHTNYGIAVRDGRTSSVLIRP